MVMEREIISPSLLYHLHHHALIFFPYSFFSLFPIIFPNSSSSLLRTLVPFSKLDFPFPLSFFHRLFFPFFSSFSAFPIWVSPVLVLCFWVARFVRGCCCLLVLLRVIGRVLK